MSDEIAESCGCVFCDFGLEPDNQIDGRPVHMHPEKGLGYSFCTCVDVDALPPPPGELT